VPGMTRLRWGEIAVPWMTRLRWGEIAVPWDDTVEVG